MGVRFDITQIRNPEIREQALRLAGQAKAQVGTRVPQTVSSVPPTPAKGKPKASAPQPNKTEAEFNRLYLGGAGQYEAITFRLAGGSRYTPDWFAVLAGQPTVIEVKGCYRHHSYGRALTAWREARAQFPCFQFAWAVRGADGHWDVEGLTGENAVGNGATIGKNAPQVGPFSDFWGDTSLSEARKKQSVHPETPCR